MLISYHSDDHPLENALATVLEEYRSQFEPERADPLHCALAISGGEDSIALLVAASRLAQRTAIQFSVLHVHHGLQAAANDWAHWVTQWAERLGLECDVLPVCVENREALGEEAAARNARYEALYQRLLEKNIKALILAHHQDDQVETILMRILRGTGLLGAQGMSTFRLYQPSRLLAKQTSSSIVLVRPWLQYTKKILQTYLQDHPLYKELQTAHDPSNQEDAYVRGWMRNHLMPILRQFRPSYAWNIQRFAHHLRTESAVVDEYMQLLATKIEKVGYQHPTCDKTAFLAQSKPVQMVFLRHWLRTRAGLSQLPTESVLLELISQIRLSHKPTRFRFLQGDVLIDQQDFVWNSFSLPQTSYIPETVERIDVLWDVAFIPGQTPVLLAIRGTCIQLVFDNKADTGLEACKNEIAGLPWVLSQKRPQHRIKVSLRRPTKTMKQIFQEQKIPEWERSAIYYLWIGDKVAYISGIGWTAEYPNFSQTAQITEYSQIHE